MSAGALDPARLASLEALVDRLLPGAREAGVAAYVDRALAGAYASECDAYTAGLDAIDVFAGVPFAGLPAPEQDEVVAALERGAVFDADGDGPFFERVRRHVIEGMFGDPRWGGNRDGAGWELIGYPGPRLVWAETDQELA